MKGRPLLPTLRTKKRYLVYEYISKQEFTHKEIIRNIINSYKECFGSFGLGMSGIMDTNIFSKKRGILKVNNKYMDNLKIALARVTKIDGNEILIHTIGVSGILNKAKIKYMNG